MNSWRDPRDIPRRDALRLGCAAIAAAALSWSPRTALAQAEGPGADFLWGVAGSAFQSEGDMPASNWGSYITSGEHPDMEPYFESVDFRHRYRDDIRLAADLGARVFRFGVNWARVEPRRDVWSEQGWAFYRDVVAEILAAGMQPMVTLDHFVYPAWILDQGGWVSDSTVERFLRYVGKATEEFAGQCPWWLIFNEPSVNVVLETRMRGLAPTESARMAANLVTAHRRAYQIIKHADPTAQVSSNEATPNLPAPARAAADSAFLSQVADGYMDFLGLDFYYPDIGVEGMLHLFDGKPWEIPQAPRVIGSVCEDYAIRYPGLPVFIIEFGMPTDNGAPRTDGLTRTQHLLDSVDSVREAKRRGVPIIGMLYWSLTDNYEWGTYNPRFGLYTVDVVTDPSLTRKPTDAVEPYRRLIAEDRW
ncbi:family 1 glycosylhydrolase [Nocardia sp. NPDC003979]